MRFYYVVFKKYTNVNMLLINRLEGGVSLGKLQVD